MRKTTLTIRGTEAAKNFFSDLLDLPTKWCQTTVVQEVKIQFKGINKNELYCYLVDRMNARL